MNSTQCLNGATCTNTNGSFLCTCADGYIGRYCSLDNECHGDSNYCGGKGSCSASVSENDTAVYLCSCDHGWEGNRCQQAVVSHHLLICITVVAVVFISSLSASSQQWFVIATPFWLPCIFSFTCNNSHVFLLLFPKTGHLSHLITCLPLWPPFF